MKRCYRRVGGGRCKKQIEKYIWCARHLEDVLTAAKEKNQLEPWMVVELRKRSRRTK